MRTIWKFAFEVDDDVTVDVPEGTEFLAHVEGRGHGWTDLTVWGIADDAAPLTSRRLHVRGTGNPLGEVGRYLGSAICGPFVWHVFEAVDA